MDMVATLVEAQAEQVAAGHAAAVKISSGRPAQLQQLQVFPLLAGAEHYEPNTFNYLRYGAC